METESLSGLCVTLTGCSSPPHPASCAPAPSQDLLRSYGLPRRAAALVFFCLARGQYPASYYRPVGAWPGTQAVMVREIPVTDKHIVRDRAGLGDQLHLFLGIPVCWGLCSLGTQH